MDSQLNNVLRDLRILQKHLGEIVSKLENPPRSVPGIAPLNLDEDGQTLAFRIIVQAVAIEFQIEPGLLDQRHGHNRTERIAVARWFAFALCREFTKATLNDIGAYFRCDHGTVLHGIRRLRDLLENVGQKERLERLRAEVAFALANPWRKDCE